MTSEKEWLEEWVRWLKAKRTPDDVFTVLQPKNLIAAFEARLTAISAPQVMKPHLFATPQLRFVIRYPVGTDGETPKRILQQLWSPLSTDRWDDCEWRDVPLVEGE